MSMMAARDVVHLDHVDRVTMGRRAGLHDTPILDPRVLAIAHPSGGDAVAACLEYRTHHGAARGQRAIQFRLERGVECASLEAGGDRRHQPGEFVLRHTRLLTGRCTLDHRKLNRQAQYSIYGRLRTPRPRPPFLPLCSCLLRHNPCSWHRYKVLDALVMHALY